MNIYLFSLLVLLSSKPVLAAQEYAASTLTLISGPSKLCAEGPMRVIGENEEAVLMVGSVISFSLDTKDSVVKSAQGQCLEVTKKNILQNKISQTTTISKCPSELKDIEGTVLQELEILSDKVIYKRTEGSKVSTCLYKRQLK